MIRALVIAVLLAATAAALVYGLPPLLALALRLIERAVLTIRNGRTKCPECYERVSLSRYTCRRCGAAHDDLIPTKGAIFARRCGAAGCGATLPTLFWFGKRRLDARCPQCDAALPAALFEANLHVPVYGLVGAGKTMLVAAVTRELVESPPGDLRVELIQADDREAYEKTVRPAFERGRTLDKTRARAPRAFLLSLRRRFGRAVQVYLYDAAGETIQSFEGVEAHGHLGHMTSAILAIDPLALAAIKAAALQKGVSIPHGSATYDHGRTVDHLAEAMHQQGRMRAAGKFHGPVAVVITKADQPIVRGELGLRLPEGRTPVPSVDAGREDSNAIRAWLATHEPDLLNRLERHFANVRYFAASAYGRENAEGRRFEPKGVLAPVAWILSHSARLAAPALARVGVGALEWGAMVAVVGVLLALPAWALARGAPIVAAAVMAIPAGAAAPEPGARDAPERPEPHESPRPPSPSARSTAARCTQRVARVAQEFPDCAQWMSEETGGVCDPPEFRGQDVGQVNEAELRGYCALRRIERGEPEPAAGPPR